MSQEKRFLEAPTVGALNLIDDGCCSVGRAASSTTLLLYEVVHRGTQRRFAVWRAHGLPFRLPSFEVAEAFSTFGPPPMVNAACVRLVGTLAAGGTIKALIALNCVLDRPGGVADFEAVTLGSDLPTRISRG